MTWSAALFLVLIGGCAGSFAATLGLRMAQGRGWAKGRSSCDQCTTPLPAAATIPLVSYALAQGRCRRCSGAIDVVHPCGEVFGAVLLPVCFWLFDIPQALLLFGLGMTLLATSVVDLKIMRLPDIFTALMGVLCAGLVLLADPARLWIGAASSAVVVFLVQALRWAGTRMKQEPGLGLGDVKLLAALAFWLGLATPWAVAGAAVFGLVGMAIVRPKEGRLPFGPFIAAACFAVGFVQEVRQWPAGI